MSDLILIMDADDPTKIHTDRKNIHIDDVPNLKYDRVFCLAEPHILQVLPKLPNKADVYLFSKLEFIKFSCCVGHIKDMLAREQLKYIRADNATFGFARYASGKGRFPVIATLSSALNARPKFCRLIASQIVDPRLFISDCTPFSRKHLNAMIKYCGLTYRIFHQMFAGGVIEHEYQRKALWSLNCWYSSEKYKQFKTLAKDKNITFYAPSETPIHPVQAPENYFWRKFINTSFVDPWIKLDPKAAFLTTKLFLFIFFRLWGTYLGLYKLRPSGYFKYRCELDRFMNAANRNGIRI